MILALDIGNTRVKWGLRDGARWRAAGTTATRPLASLRSRLAKLPRAPVVAYANVAGRGGERAVATLAAAMQAQRVRIEARAAGGGVRNAYARPGQLGADRWAALAAAWSVVRGPAVVVNAGTAATVDLLDAHGTFVGGIVCPGIGLMLDSLRRRSRALDAARGRVRRLPRSTADAMQTGAVLALTGAIEKMAATLEARCGTAPDLVLSGGDAPLLSGFGGRRVRRVPRLVLEGVALLAREELRRCE